MTRDDLLDMISKIVEEHWAKNSRPLLTSSLGVMLKEKSIDYDAVLEGGVLGKFVEANSNSVKVVRHPSQSAKVGLIPERESYTFPEDGGGYPNPTSKDAAAPSPSDALKKSRGAFYSFVKHVSLLPKEEQDKIIIPTSVIVYFLEGK